MRTHSEISPAALKQRADFDIQKGRGFWVEAQAQAHSPSAKAFITYYDNLVIVTSGRKAPIGTTGTVFWMRPSDYGDEYRLGIKDSSGNGYWTTKKNVELVDPHSRDKYYCKENLQKFIPEKRLHGGGGTQKRQLKAGIS